MCDFAIYLYTFPQTWTICIKLYLDYSNISSCTYCSIFCFMHYLFCLINSHINSTHFVDSDQIILLCPLNTWSHFSIVEKLLDAVHTTFLSISIHLFSYPGVSMVPNQYSISKYFFVTLLTYGMHLFLLTNRAVDIKSIT